MKFYRKLAFALIILTLTIGAVCADDMNQTDGIQSENPKSFTDFKSDLSKNYPVFDVRDDYAFNNESDGTSGIIILKSNITINGNGHTLDGGNKSRIFYIIGKNVTINDLILTNAYTSLEGGAIHNSGSAILNNVTFTQNRAAENGGAISNGKGGIVNCEDCRFIDNYAEAGASIASSGGGISITNAEISSKVANKYGQIYARDCELEIANVTFENIAANYCPAMYIRSSNASINNSAFRNLKASISAGAIALKETKSVLIYNCQFANTSSSKNAGAINADISGEDGNEGNVTIICCTFKNTSSSFGGACIQLGGELVLVNTNFENCRATFNGGAVYFSQAVARISNCTFDSNGVETIEGYPTYGGAIYADSSVTGIGESTFKNNFAYLGNAIYCYDVGYEISNSTFKNNTNDIYSHFDKNTSDLSNNTYSSSHSLSLNNTFYPYCVAGEGIELTLQNSTTDNSTIPSKFDLRDWGWVSPVKDQGWTGSCWAFGMTGALESSLLKATGTAANLSENNMKNLMLYYSIYGAPTFESGSNIHAMNYLLSWHGAIPQEADAYDEVGKISQLTTDKNIHIQDIMLISHEIPDGTQMKEAIMKYGSLNVCYYGQASYDQKNQYYNDETHAHYCNESIDSNHQVSIVGWDDSYPKENFLITPPGNGAWIVKNSWGDDWGDKGYFYISYYDRSLVQSKSIYTYATAIVLENSVAYNRNYQYDYAFLGNFKNTTDNGNLTFANQFEALDDDLIAAVGTYFYNETYDYEIRVYVNGELKLTQEGKSPYYGFKTVKLDKYIPVKKGDIFRVEMTSKYMPFIDLETVRYRVKENSSFIYDSGKWHDLTIKNHSVAAIKVYTVCGDSGLNTSIMANESISVLVGELKDGVKFNMTLVSDGETLSNRTMAITFNGKTDEYITDENGMISYEIPPVSAGNYTIEMEFAGDAIYNPSNATATVNVIRDESRIYLRNALYFVTETKIVRVTLQDVKGNPLSGKTVRIAVADSRYSAITDENGEAYIRIGVGYGNHTATLSFDGDDEYAACNRTGTVRVIRQTPSIMLRYADSKFNVHDKTKTVKIYLWDRESKPLPAGSKVAVKVNGKTYIGHTDKNGIAKISIDIAKAGTYTAELKYAGNSAFNAVSKKAKIYIRD